MPLRETFPDKFHDLTLILQKQIDISHNLPLGEVVKNMIVVATLTHPPELCLARKEFSTEYKQWADGMNDLAKNLGITVRGAYICPNEHTFWFILDSKGLNSVTAFFAGIMLTNHTGKISSVISLKEAGDLLLK